MIHKLFLQDTLCENVLIFDGLTRSGRAMTAPLISDLNRVDYLQISNPVDHIPVLWWLKLIDLQSAASFLRMTVDGCTYERMVGRHLNTRMSDQHSVYQSLNAKQIIERSFGPEHQAAVDKFNAEGRISSFMAHHSLPMAELWFTAFPKLRIVVTVRHPVDVCDSWNRRGWGERWGNDPLSFWPVPEIDGAPVPWFAIDFAELYMTANPMSRIVKSIMALNKMNDDTIDTLDAQRRAQVYELCFEKIAVDPRAELQKIADWLDTGMHTNVDTAFAMMRVPRELKIENRRAKLEKIRAEVSADLYDEFIAACRAYETKHAIEPGVAPANA